MAEQISSRSDYRNFIRDLTETDKPAATYEDDIPPGDVGKSYQYANKSAMSDPSVSIDEVNVPEVTGQRGEFVYNFYVQDERVNPPSDLTLPLSRMPRYVVLNWSRPPRPSFSSEQPSNHTIADNAEKIVSEDNFFNPGYVNHTFSNVDSIEQGASDLEKYSRMSNVAAESVFKMSQYQIKETTSKSTQEDTTYQQQIAELTETYSKLADMPKDSLGLRVYDKNGALNDQDDLIRSVTNSISLTMKINSAVLSDVFSESKLKMIPSVFKDVTSIQTKKPQSGAARTLGIRSVDNRGPAAGTSLVNPVELVGYVINRYVVTPDGFKKEKEFYVERINDTRFEDRTVLYGVTYVYSVRTIAAVKVYVYRSNQTKPDLSTIFVGSRPVSIPIECYEYSPPPEPNNLSFFFNYSKRNLSIAWDMPVNPQMDVKQFQVFRRKSIREPFELIAQYGFDMTTLGPNMSKYTTGERVDANNVNMMSRDDVYLVKLQDSDVADPGTPTYFHVDDDFYVDPETLVSSDYIYAICSIDAHGMISNYSAQYQVSFDSYKNRLMTKIVCDAGSPRQYPNMKLIRDAFKDAINVQGDSARVMNVYFTPEYLTVSDNAGRKRKVMNCQTSKDKNSYYLLQLINLDNQKLQTVRIEVRDPNDLSV